MSLKEDFGGIVVWTSPNNEDRAWSDTRHEVTLTKEGVKVFLERKLIVPVKENERLFSPVNPIQFQQEIEVIEEELGF